MKVKIFNSQTLGELKELNLTLATGIGRECTVGRSPNSSLVLDSPDVSRLHAKFFLRDGNYYFCDLGSRNGSIVNGKLAETNQIHMLKIGDVVRIGEFVLIMEAISAVPEDLAETVFAGMDATVISGWRSNANLDTPEVANQAPAEVSTPEVANQAPAEVSKPEVMAQSPEVINAPEVINHSPEAVSEVPELVISESELVTPAPEEVSEFEVTTIQDLTIIQTPQEPSEFEVTSIQEVTVIQAPEEPESKVTSAPATESVNESELTPEAVSETPEESAQVPAAVSETPEESAQVPAAVSEASEMESPEVASQVPAELIEFEVTTVQDLTSIQIPESAAVVDAIAPAPEEPEAVVSKGIIIRAPEDEPELVNQTPEAAVSEATDVQVPPEVSKAASEVITHTPEAVTEAPEVTSQAPESAESEVIAQTPEPVSEIFETTYIQAPEVLEEVEVVDAMTPAPEAVNEVSEPAPEAISEAPEEIAQVPAAVSEASEMESSEVASQVSTELIESEVTIVQDLTSIQIPESAAVVDAIAPVSEEPEAVVSEVIIIQAPEEPKAVVPQIPIIQAPEEPELVTQTPEAAVSEATDVQAPPEVLEAASEVITHTPEAVIEAPEVLSQEPKSAESEVMAQTPEPVSEVHKIISEKYIAFMAHDSKKPELAQFVAQHREFFSKCRTIATPSISEALYQQTGVAISRQTPLVPVGGYQAVASLVGSGEMLAVIFLRDFMLAQAGQANDEALLRLCNVNQVLLATNVATAEAIVNYLQR